jgi:hypothetical protein
MRVVILLARGAAAMMIGYDAIMDSILCCVFAIIHDDGGDAFTFSFTILGHITIELFTTER